MSRNRYSLGPPAVPKHNNDKVRKHKSRRSNAWEEVHRANLDEFRSTRSNNNRRSYNVNSVVDFDNQNLSPKSMTSFERRYLLQSCDNFSSRASSERIGSDQIYHLENSSCNSHKSGSSVNDTKDTSSVDDESSRLVSIRQPVNNPNSLSPRNILLTQAVLLSCGQTQTTLDCLNIRPYLLRERLQKLKQEASCKLLSLPSKSCDRVHINAALLQVFMSPHESGFLRVTFAKTSTLHCDYASSTIIQCGHFPEMSNLLVLVIVDPESQRPLSSRKVTLYLFAAVSQWSGGRHSAHSSLSDLFSLPCCSKYVASSSQVVITPAGRCNILDFPSDCRSFVDQVIKTFGSSDGYQLGLSNEAENIPDYSPSTRLLQHRVSNSSFSTKCSSSSISDYKTNPHTRNESLRMPPKFTENSSVPNIALSNSSDNSVFKKPLPPNISNSCENMQHNFSLRKSFRNKQFQSHESISTMSDQYISSSPDPFDIWLQDSYMIIVFERFCQSQYCAENVHFWQDANEYKGLKTKSEMSKKGEKMFQKYFDESGPETINISFFMLKTVKENLKNPTTTLFDEVMEHIYKLMKSDIYPRFKISDLYHEYENGGTSDKSNKNNDNRRKSFLSFFRKNRKSDQMLNPGLTISGNERRSLSKSPSRTHSTITSLFKKNVNVRQLKANATSPGSLKKADSLQSFNSEDLNNPNKEKHGFFDLLTRCQNSGLHDQREIKFDKLELPDFFKSPRSRAMKNSDSCREMQLCSSQPANLNVLHLDDKRDKGRQKPADLMRSSPYLNTPPINTRRLSKIPIEVLDLPIGGSLDQFQPSLSPPVQYSEPVSPKLGGKSVSTRVSVTSPSTPKVQDQRQRFSNVLADLSADAGSCESLDDGSDVYGIPSPSARILVKESDKVSHVQVSGGIDYSASRSSRTQSNATAASLFTEDEDDGEDEDDDDEGIILV